MARSALGIDIGGSFIKFAPVDVDTGETLVEPAEIPLPQPATPAKLSEAIGALTKSLKWSGSIGVGYPGVIKHGRTMSAAHMDSSFIGRDWLTDLKTLTKESVGLINDADAAGLAEVRFGAAKDFASPDSGTALVITLGTGIGSALFVGGRLLPNTEFGHMQMGEREAEDWAAAAVRIKEALDWPDYGKRVNLFLREMDKLVSPDLIVVGGGISENFSKFRAHIKVTCPVVTAQLGNRAGLIGAALATKLSS
jgi:polyphosphate glucokinase